MKVCVCALPRCMVSTHNLICLCLVCFRSMPTAESAECTSPTDCTRKTSCQQSSSCTSQCKTRNNGCFTLHTPLCLSVSLYFSFFLFLYHYSAYYSRAHSEGQKLQEHYTLESDNFQDQSQREAFPLRTFLDFHPRLLRRQYCVWTSSGPFLSSSWLVCDVMMLVSLLC